MFPGQTGGIDPGHADSHEIFYVSRGEVLMHTPNDGKYYQLEEGDKKYVMLYESLVELFEIS